MYLEIYPDVIFVINFLMDLIILMIIKKINKKNCNIWRIISGAFVGGIISTVAEVLIWDRPIIKFIVIYIFTSIAMIFIIFKKPKLSELMKGVVQLYAISFCLAGTINFIYYHRNIRHYIVEIHNHIFYKGFSLFTLFVLMIIIIPILTLIITIYNNLYINDKNIFDVELIINGKAVQGRALMDTGNNLYYPIDGRPVIIVEYRLIEDFLEDDYLYRVKPIPFKSIGKKDGFIMGIDLERIIIYTNASNIVREKVLVGIYRGSLSSKSEYQILLHKELL